MGSGADGPARQRAPVRRRSATVTVVAVQVLAAVPCRFTVREHSGQVEFPDGEWWAVVSTPAGRTVIAPAMAGDPAEDTWRGLHAAEGHALDLPGMLAAVVSPLGAANVPVFVASTWQADLVLVPVARWDDAVRALTAAGHTVQPDG